jgi:hypothetical protein
MWGKGTTKENAENFRTTVRHIEEMDARFVPARDFYTDFVIMKKVERPGVCANSIQK